MDYWNDPYEPCKDDYLYSQQLPEHWDERTIYFECTKEDGHEGDHVADGVEGQIFATWKRGEGQKGPSSR